MSDSGRVPLRRLHGGLTLVETAVASAVQTVARTAVETAVGIGLLAAARPRRLGVVVVATRRERMSGESGMVIAVTGIDPGVLMIAGSPKMIVIELRTGSVNKRMGPTGMIRRVSNS